MSCEGDFCRWRILARLNEYKSTVFKVGPFPGELENMSFVGFSYNAKDVLCLEKIKLHNGQTSREIIQDYLSWGWDVTTGRQTWTPQVFFLVEF